MHLFKQDIHLILQGGHWQKKWASCPIASPPCNPYLSIPTFDALLHQSFVLLVLVSEEAGFAVPEH